MIIEIDIIDIRNEDSLNLIRYLTLAFFGGGGGYRMLLPLSLFFPLHSPDEGYPVLNKKNIIPLSSPIPKYNVRIICISQILFNFTLRKCSIEESEREWTNIYQKYKQFVCPSACVYVLCLVRRWPRACWAGFLHGRKFLTNIKFTSNSTHHPPLRVYADIGEMSTLDFAGRCYCPPIYNFLYSQMITHLVLTRVNIA